jgi:hypothetical protein
VDLISSSTTSKTIETEERSLLRENVLLRTKEDAEVAGNFLKTVLALEDFSQSIQNMAGVS